MKSAREEKRDGRAVTLITCGDCGNEITVQGHMTCLQAQRAVERKCRPCNPVIRQGGTNWWSQFGLKKNPYVYGPMPRLRTSERWRIEEARQRGWLAWYWNDEYTEQRLRPMHSKLSFPPMKQITSTRDDMQDETNALQ